MAKSKTFAIPLKKKGSGALDSMFNHKGYKAVREAYDRLGGNPFGIKPDEPLKEKWFCSNSGCSFWRDTDGTSHGSCQGMCMYG